MYVQEFLLFGLAIFIAVNADVSHLQLNDNGYNYPHPHIQLIEGDAHNSHKPYSNGQPKYNQQQQLISNSNGEHSHHSNHKGLNSNHHGELVQEPSSIQHVQSHAIHQPNLNENYQLGSNRHHSGSNSNGYAENNQHEPKLNHQGGLNHQQSESNHHDQSHSSQQLISNSNAPCGSGHQHPNSNSNHHDQTHVTKPHDQIRLGYSHLNTKNNLQNKISHPQTRSSLNDHSQNTNNNDHSGSEPLQPKTVSIKQNH